MSTVLCFLTKSSLSDLFLNKIKLEQIPMNIWLPKTGLGKCQHFSFLNKIELDIFIYGRQKCQHFYANTSHVYIWTSEMLIFLQECFAVWSMGFGNVNISIGMLDMFAYGRSKCKYSYRNTYIWIYTYIYVYFRNANTSTRKLDILDYGRQKCNYFNIIYIYIFDMFMKCQYFDTNTCDLFYIWTLEMSTFV